MTREALHSTLMLLMGVCIGVLIATDEHRQYVLSAWLVLAVVDLTATRARRQDVP